MFAVLMAVVLAAFSHQGSLSVSDGWVKAPFAGETSALAFVVISNPTMYDDYLVAATSDVATAIEIREGAAGNSKVLKSITVSAYDKLTMTPDGVYLQLLQLTRPLKAGETVALQLTTDNGITLHVAAVVK